MDTTDDKPIGLLSDDDVMELASELIVDAKERHGVIDLMAVFLFMLATNEGMREVKLIGRATAARNKHTIEHVAAAYYHITL